jgi:hypothetical protein
MDKNYGGIFSFWDRLFGTYADEREDDIPVYGVRKPLQSWNPLWANFNHFAYIWQQVRQAQGWRNKLMHVFASPAWTPVQADATPPFAGENFQRFETPTTPRLRQLALGTTIAGALLLIAFFAVQSKLPVPIRVGYCTAMVLILAAIGRLMTRSTRAPIK